MSATTSGDPSSPAPDFETALKRLERLVASLERGDLDLSGALAAYEDGVKLLGQCHGLLDAAERKVTLLTGVNDDGTPSTTPFDATATATTPSERPQAPGPRGTNTVRD